MSMVEELEGTGGSTVIVEIGGTTCADLMGMVKEVKKVATYLVT